MEKGKKNKKKDNDKEVVVDKKDLIGSLDSYIKEKGEIIKAKEKEKEIIDEETNKLKKILNEKISEVDKLATDGKTEEINKLAKKALEKAFETQLKSFVDSLKSETSLKESTQLNNNLIKVSSRCTELEKLNKFYLDKLRDINEEKKQIINEEKEKRNQIVAKTEEFMKDFQQKFEASIPEKEELIKENQMLKQKLEEYVTNTNQIKENLESQMLLKDKQNLLFEEELRNQIQAKMEEFTTHSQKFLLENAELKNKNLLYAKKFEEVNKSVQQSNEIFAKMKDELDKRAARIVLLEKELVETRNKEKSSLSNLLDLQISHENLKKENEVIKKQLSGLTTFSKSLQDKVKLLQQNQEKNLPQTQTDNQVEKSEVSGQVEEKKEN